MRNKKISVNADKKNVIMGILLILLGILAPLIFNVYNFKIYDLLYDSLSNDDKEFLIVAAVRLVLLNSIRGLPHYLGTFIIAESITINRDGKSLRHANGIIALIIIPLVYSLITSIHSIKYDLGVPAFIVVFAIMYLEKLDYSKISFVSKSIIIILFLFGAQWLDIIPQLSVLRFGRGETSQDIKNVASIIGGCRILTVFGTMLFIVFTLNALLVTKLIKDQNKILIKTQEKERVERELNKTQIKAMQARYYTELKHLVHDLKTPLTSMQALIGVIGLMEECTKRQVYLSKIETSIENMSKMISEILYEEKKNIISTEELFDYIFSQVSPLPLALKIKYNNKAKDEYLKVNKVRISRAIINALDNSYNALDKDVGNIYVNVNSVNDKIHINIEDDGIGIEDDLMENIKMKGFSKSNSTGLGLKFIEDVVKNHDGEMHISSKYGEGTSLLIILPKEVVNEEVTYNG